MKPIKQVAVTVLAAAAPCQPRANAQTPAVPTPPELAQALGFSDAEVSQIEAGEIVSKDLKEGSEEELAGVVAVLFKKPVGELAEIVPQGKLLKSDKRIQALRGWKPDASVDEAFAGLGLEPTESDEAKVFWRAPAGEKLNLSAAEIQQFRKAGRELNALNAQLQAMLKARYEACPQRGLNGIAPCARSGSKTASPGKLRHAGRRSGIDDR